MSNNDVFSTPKILDVTKLEIAKVQEAEATKRSMYEDDIRLKIERSQNFSHLLQQPEFYVIGFITIAVLGIAAAILTNSYFDHRWPEQPACVDSQVVLGRENNKQTCPPGATLESHQLDKNTVEITCHCEKKQVLP